MTKRTHFDAVIKCEVVLVGNIFKYQNHDAAVDFKKSHMNQSTATRKIVSEVKNS
jgi:hypothetical protein